MKKEARLVLGGGSAYGLAHIGAIVAVREKYRITGIVGTSMGAIIGGLAAQGVSPERMLELAQDYSIPKLFNPFRLKFKRSGIFDGRAVLELFEQWTGGARIEDGQIPFVAIAYDLIRKTTVLIDKGPLALAMRASSSLPYIFPPQQIGGYLLVDGGVEHPLPLAFRDAVPGQETIAVNVLPPVSMRAERIDVGPDVPKLRPRPHKVFVQALMQNQGFVAIQSVLNKPPELIIDAHCAKLRLHDLAKVQQFYDYGYAAAKEAIEAHREPSFRETLLKRYQAVITRMNLWQ